MGAGSFCRGGTRAAWTTEEGSTPSPHITRTFSYAFCHGFEALPPSSSISPTDIEILRIAFAPIPRALRKALERAFVWFAL